MFNSKSIAATNNALIIFIWYSFIIFLYIKNPENNIIGVSFFRQTFAWRLKTLYRELGSHSYFVVISDFVLLCCHNACKSPSLVKTWRTHIIKLVGVFLKLLTTYGYEESELFRNNFAPTDLIAKSNWQNRDYPRLRQP